MNKLNTWLLKNIFWILLYLAISGLLFQFVDILNFKQDSFIKWIYLFFDFSYSDLKFFDLEVFTFKRNLEGSSYYYKSYLDIVFYLLFITSVVVYKLSNYRETKVIKFCLSIISLFTILSFLYQVYILFIFFELKGFLGILFLLKAVLTFYVCYFYLKTWKLEREYIQSEENQLSDFKTFQLKPASKWKRLAHHIIDVFLILCIFSKNLFDFYIRTLIQDFQSLVGENIAGWIIFFVFTTTYYLIFEALFKATPAKYLTQTSVVSLDKKPVSFLNILGRTLSRKIPFEGFSFLGKLGLHDSLSKTTVADQVKEPSQYKVFYFVFITLCVLFFLYEILVVFHFIHGF